MTIISSSPVAVVLISKKRRTASRRKALHMKMWVGVHIADGTHAAKFEKVSDR